MQTCLYVNYTHDLNSRAHQAPSQMVHFSLIQGTLLLLNPAAIIRQLSSSAPTKLWAQKYFKETTNWYAVYQKHTWGEKKRAPFLCRHKIKSVADLNTHDLYALCEGKDNERLWKERWAQVSIGSWCSETDRRLVPAVLTLGDPDVGGRYRPHWEDREEQGQAQVPTEHRGVKVRLAERVCVCVCVRVCVRAGFVCMSKTEGVRDRKCRELGCAEVQRVCFCECVCVCVYVSLSFLVLPTAERRNEGIVFLQTAGSVVVQVQWPQPNQEEVNLTRRKKYGY